MAVAKPKTFLTPAVKALIGQETEVTEMYGVIDQETVRRYVVGIPDQDPRHWDEDLAKERFGTTTAPAAMISYTALRSAPWEEDHFHELMLEDPWRDQVSMRRPDSAGLAEVRAVAGTRSHLHGGDELEVYAYPKLGDRIFFQTRYADIQEKLGSNGQPFLLITRETRFWNQDDQTLLILRALGIER